MATRLDFTAADILAPGHLPEATVHFGQDTHVGKHVGINAFGPNVNLFHGVQWRNVIYRAITIRWARKARCAGIDLLEQPLAATTPRAVQ